MSKFCAARLCPRQYLLAAPAGLGRPLLSLLPAAVSSPLRSLWSHWLGAKLNFVATCQAGRKMKNRSKCPNQRRAAHTDGPGCVFTTRKRRSEMGRTRFWRCRDEPHAKMVRLVSARDLNGQKWPNGIDCAELRHIGLRWGPSVRQFLFGASVSNNNQGGNGGQNLTQAETGRTNFGHSRTYSWRAGFVCGAPL